MQPDNYKPLGRRHFRRGSRELSQLTANMIFSLLALSFAPESKVDPFGCHKETDCTSCIEKTAAGLYYGCDWCTIDNACHDVGSFESPCSPPSADDKCVSLSGESNCQLKQCS